MLQQTQVATVVPYYERFTRRFPDVETLAQASEDEVLSLWSGLGYYRRARALHAAAKQLVADHAGRVPSDPAVLRQLPGIGRYTAGAISSIAFDLPEPVLDGNVRRVLARVLALDGAKTGLGAMERELWEAATDLVKGPRPGDLNQALMELGALVCTPRGPNCKACPVAVHCRARANGDPEAYPAARARKPTVRVRVAVALVSRGRRVLLEQPESGGPFRGRWDLPAVQMTSTDDGGEALRDGVKARHGLEIRPGGRTVVASHGIMHRRLRLEVHRCSLLSGSVASNAALRWVDPDDLPDVPVSGATRKVLGLCDEPG